MDWTDWYTDTADVFRNEKVTENSLTHMERRKVLSGVACRVYQTKPSGLRRAAIKAWQPASFGVTDERDTSSSVR